MDKPLSYFDQNLGHTMEMVKIYKEGVDCDLDFRTEFLSNGKSGFLKIR